jgi:phosphoribosyl-ATP pyrophosphohydrolase
MMITELYATILSRKQNPSEASYTSSLFAKGLPRIAQKVGEEGTEVVVAALSQDDARLVEEIADLTYHVLVLMAARGVSPQAVELELEKRKR